MPPPHLGRAKKHLDCGPRPTRFRSCNRPETVERASIEARSEAPESHRRVRGNKSGPDVPADNLPCRGRDASSVRRTSRSLVGAAVCLTRDAPHQRWATPRHGPRSWGCCFAITEPDGAANGERRRMTRTHDTLRAASAEGLAMPGRAREGAVGGAKSSRKQGGSKPSQRRVAAGES